MTSIASAASIKSETSIKSTASVASAVSRTSTVFHTSAFGDAMEFADEFRSLSRDLDQARATHTNVRKLAEANNFRIIDWAALEGTWPLDHEKVLKQLEAEIEAKVPAFEAAKEGLEVTLALLDEAEHRSWWEQCQLKYSSMVCFVDYVPPVIEETVIEEDATEEHAIENNNIAKENTHREPIFEEDIFWLDYLDKEVREIARKYGQEVRNSTK